METRKPVPITVLAQRAGHCVEILTDNVANYHEWIRGEGGDISLIRAMTDRRLIGAFLPLRSNWDGRVITTAIDDDPVAASDEDKRLDYIYDAVDALLKLGRFQTVNNALLGIGRDEPKNEMLAWLTATLPVKDMLSNRPAIIQYARDKGYPIEGLE